MPGCSKIGKLLEMVTAYFFLTTTNITKYIHSFIAQCMYRWVTSRPVENEVRRVLPSLSSKQIALPLSPKIQSGTYVRTRTHGAIHLIPFRTVRVPSAKSRMFVQVRDAGLHTRSSSLSRLVQVCYGAENGLLMPGDGIWCVSILLLFVPFFLSLGLLAMIWYIN